MSWHALVGGVCVVMVPVREIEKTERMENCRESRISHNANKGF